MIETALSDDNSLLGAITYQEDSNSYIARIFRANTTVQIDYKSFGNGVQAVNWMLDQLEYPGWTLLKA